MEGTLIVKRELLIAKVEIVSDRDAETARDKQSPIRTFEDLDVWKICRDLRRQIAEIARTFPHEEKYRLANQLIRASRSVRQILPRDMDGSIMRRMSSLHVRREGLFMKS
jgi:hypothetical protein